MIVYTATKQQFVDDVRANAIADIIEGEVARKLNRNSPRNEFVSWQNSLRYMFQVLVDPAIPASADASIKIISSLNAVSTLSLQVKMLNAKTQLKIKYMWLKNVPIY